MNLLLWSDVICNLKRKFLVKLILQFSPFEWFDLALRYWKKRHLFCKVFSSKETCSATLETSQSKYNG